MKLQWPAEPQRCHGHTGVEVQGKTGSTGPTGNTGATDPTDAAGLTGPAGNTRATETMGLLARLYLCLPKQMEWCL